VAESGVSEGLERFAFGWSRFSSVSPAGSPFRLINPDLGFLGASPFVAKTTCFGRCISLDFLGFSRPDRDLSMGYAKKPEKNFSSRFCRRERSVETAAHDLGMAKGRIAHGASLTRFLIVCKRLSPGPFGLGASLQSELALIRD
jgi:hypothetical protein